MSIPEPPAAGAPQASSTPSTPATPPTPPTRPEASQPTASALHTKFLRIHPEVSKVVVGQEGAVSGLVVALLADGHVLLEGAPGVGKTLLVRTLSHVLSIETRRLQFTPDLMPGDVTGSLIYDASEASFEFRPGPVFTNLLLADEINRTPPKTQSALLEAMEERQVSVDGVTRPLPEPFLVAATQNPIEYEGTYSLPEAQLDRFLLKLTLSAPEQDDEFVMLRRHADGFAPRDLAATGIEPVLSAGDLAAARREVRKVAASDDVVAYIVALARGTRFSPSVRLGVSPRGTAALLAAAKAWAWFSGYAALTPDHVQAMLLPVWRHRMILQPEAELEGVSADTILTNILRQTQVPL